MEKRNYKKNKEYRINIRVNEEEYASVKKQAKENRMNMTDYLLMLVDKDKGKNHFLKLT